LPKPLLIVWLYFVSINSQRRARLRRIAKPEHRQAVCMVAKALADRSDQQPAELG
jgi:hypothetical protein